MEVNAPVAMAAAPQCITVVALAKARRLSSSVFIDDGTANQPRTALALMKAYTARFHNINSIKGGARMLTLWLLPMASVAMPKPKAPKTTSQPSHHGQRMAVCQRR